MVTYNFKTDVFEDMILQDLARASDEILHKLNRNITNEFSSWLKTKLEAKENISINIMGSTRCVAKGSKVLMANLEYKNIEKCRSGELVISYDIEKKEIVIRPILKVWDNGEREVYLIKLSNRKNVISTLDHKFLTLHWHRLKPLKELDIATDLVAIKSDYNTNLLEIGSASVINIERIGKLKTYDLTIADTHTYCVDGLVCHNSGKSLCGLKAVYNITKFYNRDINKEINRIVCGNQREYRQSLLNANFGEVRQVDENAFSNSGAGSYVETQQLKDIQNIIAKKNIHTIYITPRTFLDTGAIIGLKTWGKDPKNWATRLLVYDIRGSVPTLLGYIIIDVGSLFKDEGCFIYEYTGGCTNPKKLKPSEIPKNAVEKSTCLPKKYKKEDLVCDGVSCPFYKVCNHFLCQYEHKKDTWIEKEMKGGLSERQLERLKVALEFVKKYGTYNEAKSMITLKAKNQQDIMFKINLFAPKITNAKLTGEEKKEIATAIFNLVEPEGFISICKELEVDWKKEIRKIENISDDYISMLEEINQVENE